jgi:hypothetical protein
MARMLLESAPNMFYHVLICADSRKKIARKKPLENLGLNPYKIFAGDKKVYDPLFCLGGIG